MAVGAADADGERVEEAAARKAPLGAKGVIGAAGGKRPSGLGSAQAIVLVLVVLFGCANNIAKQVVAKRLERFDYMLGLVSSSSYVVLYWAILAVLLMGGAIEGPGLQFQWVWRGWSERACRRSATARPGLKLFLAAAAGDAFGDVFGYLCTPYVSGPVHSLLAQCTTVFTALLSLCILRKRYSLMQCSALITVLSATTIGVLPNLRKTGANGSDPVMSAILAGSCMFNAFAFVMKEVAFECYTQWAVERRSSQGLKDAETPTLNIFVANSAESTLQLPITLLLVPLAVALGQTHGDSLAEYLSEGFACLGGAGGCQHVPLCTVAYVVFNISWNICILLSVKWNGALATFVALKAIMPISAVLFAYVDWPLLGRTPLEPITWLSLAVVLPAIVAFTWGSRQQSAREERGEATCCWPIHQRREEPGSSESEPDEGSNTCDNQDESAEEG